MQAWSVAGGTAGAAGRTSAGSIDAVTPWRHIIGVLGYAGSHNVLATGPESRTRLPTGMQTEQGTDGELTITSRPSRGRGAPASSTMQASITAVAHENLPAVPTTALPSLPGDRHEVIVLAGWIIRHITVGIGLIDEATGPVQTRGTGLADGQRDLAEHRTGRRRPRFPTESLALSTSGGATGVLTGGGVITAMARFHG